MLIPGTKNPRNEKLPQPVVFSLAAATFFSFPVKTMLLPMLSLLLLLVQVVTGEDCECGVENIRTRIISGRPSRPYSFPWVVYIEFSDGWETGSCTGSLISRKFVMAAAHCVPSYGMRNPLRTMRVSLYQGCDRNRTFAGASYRVKRATPHPNFKWAMGEGFDISILELEKAVGPTVTPICLTSNRTIGDEFGSSVAAGWGLVNVGFEKQDAECLNEADLDVPTERECRSYWPGHNLTAVMCAGGQTNVCAGDSGGALMRRHEGRVYAQGIASHSRNDCGILTKTPGIFERVSNHIEWIQSVTGKDELCVK